MRLYTAKWCDPCKEVKAHLLKNPVEGLEVLDIDDVPEGVLALGIKKVPTLVADGTMYVGRENIYPFLEALNNDS